VQASSAKRKSRTSRIVGIGRLSCLRWFSGIIILFVSLLYKNLNRKRNSETEPKQAALREPLVSFANSVVSRHPTKPITTRHYSLNNPPANMNAIPQDLQLPLVVMVSEFACLPH
jgi:hypothetical protein